MPLGAARRGRDRRIAYTQTGGGGGGNLGINLYLYCFGCPLIQINFYPLYRTKRLGPVLCLNKAPRTGYNTMQLRTPKQFWSIEFPSTTKA